MSSFSGARRSLKVAARRSLGARRAERREGYRAAPKSAPGTGGPGRRSLLGPPLDDFRRTERTGPAFTARLGCGGTQRLADSARIARHLFLSRLKGRALPAQHDSASIQSRAAGRLSRSRTRSGSLAPGSKAAPGGGGSDIGRVPPAHGAGSRRPRSRAATERARGAPRRPRSFGHGAAAPAASARLARGSARRASSGALRSPVLSRRATPRRRACARDAGTRRPFSSRAEAETAPGQDSRMPVSSSSPRPSDRSSPARTPSQLSPQAAQPSEFLEPEQPRQAGRPLPSPPGPPRADLQLRRSRHAQHPRRASQSRFRTHRCRPESSGRRVQPHRPPGSRTPPSPPASSRGRISACRGTTSRSLNSIAAESAHAQQMTAGAPEAPRTRTRAGRRRTPGGRRAAPRGSARRRGRARARPSATCVAIGRRPVGSSRSAVTSSAPKDASVSVRGIGVAVSTSTSGITPFLRRARRAGARRSRCCSSTTARPSRGIRPRPRAARACPRSATAPPRGAARCAGARRSSAGVEPVSSAAGTSAPGISAWSVAKCCSASVSVGAMSARLHSRARPRGASRTARRRSCPSRPRP